MRLDVKVNAAPATDEFKAARRDANRRLAAGLKVAGERVALPAARRNAPRRSGELASSLVVKASSNHATLTTNLRGKKGRRVGLLNYGGTVKAPILPRKKKALYFGGHFYASVTAPRVIKGTHFLNRAIDDNRAMIDQAIEAEVMKSFQGFGE